MTIEQYLQQNRMTRSHFAVAIGVTAARVTQLLSGGKDHPSPELAATIERVTNGAVTAAELLVHCIPPGYRLERIAPEPPPSTEALP